jgi:hypothetical protein
LAKSLLLFSKLHPEYTKKIDIQESAPARYFALNKAASFVIDKIVSYILLKFGGCPGGS